MNPLLARARWAVIGAAVLFSTGGAAIKGVELSAWTVAGLRSGVAAVALAALYPQALRGWRPRLLPAAGAYAATLVCFVLATKWTTAAAAIFLQSTAPFWVLLLSPWLLGERPSRRDIPYLIAAGGGLLLVFLGSRDPSSTAPAPAVGNVVALAAGVGYALLILSFRHLARRRTDDLETTRAAILGNALAALATTPFLELHAALAWKPLAAVLYLGIFQIALAYRWFGFGLRHLPALEVSLLVLLEPVLNPLWTAWVTGEIPSPLALAGGAILLGSLAARTLAQSRP